MIYTILMYILYLRAYQMVKFLFFILWEGWKNLRFIKINFLGMRPYIYNVHKEQVGVGGGDLEICNVFAESIVFKRYIYC